MAAPREVLKLVERFDQHRDAYRSGKYNEALDRDLAVLYGVEKRVLAQAVKRNRERKQIGYGAEQE